MGRIIKKIQNKQYGQAMVEFALTLPIFLLLVLGVIELSRFFLVYSSVYTASREASRYASSVGDETNKNYLNCEAIANMAISMGNFGGVQLDDITIFYESTPGSIIASCPNLNTGTVPVKGNCHNGSITCDSNTPKFIPSLGNRVLVSIETEYDSILGIVPNLPVRANNGRTIMMNIEVDATPIPRELCANFVFYSDTDPQLGNSNKKFYDDDLSDPLLDNSNKIFYRNLVNESEKSNFQIFSITDINWNSTKYGDPKLKKIYWKPWNATNELLIWENPDINADGFGDDGSTVGALSLPYNIQNDYWTEYNRILPAKPEGETASNSTIYFLFTHNVSASDFNFTFNLDIQNTSIPADICSPLEK